MRSPAWIRFVLSTLAPRGRTHEAIGDLEEVHRRRLEAGASRPAAWCASSLEGLGVAAALVACRLIDREPWSALLNATEWRLAARRSLRQPLMSLVTIFALAVGIALAVTAFSALEATLFAEVPFEAGDRFVRLRLLEERTGAGQLDLDRYRALGGERDVFEHVGAAGFDLVNLRYDSGEIESITASLLTPETFSYLPYAPILGRPFSADDGAPGAPPVALIRESLWHRRFGGERTALGRTLQINGAAHTLVGVLPDEATFPARSEVWIPLGARFVGGNVHGPHPAAQAFAVLAAGVSTPQAQERVDLISRRVAEERGETRETRVELNSFTQMPPGALPGLSILVTVLVMLLMVVASNISNLNLVRISARSSELAMRAALGASRPLLIGQILGEILLLCALAAVLGVAASSWALQFFNETLVERPFWVDFSSGPWSYAFVLALTLLVSAIGGLIPALGATRAASIGRLGSGFGPSRGRGGGFGRAGATMTILEMGLSVALISGSLMMAKGLAGYADGVLEVPEDRILTARLVAPTPAPGAPADFQSLPASLRRAADGIPGVLAFGITSSLPRTDAPARPVEIAHEAREAAGPAPAAAPIVEVRQGFLEALGARSLVGRLFEERDFADGALPVAVVNERFVDQFLGGRAAVGRRIRGPGSERTGEDREWEIVGVVPELGLSVADPDRAAGFYVPMARVPQALYVTLRTSDKPATVANALRRAVAEVDPGVRVLKVLPLPLVGREERSFFAGLGSSLVAMGGLALLLSLIGIYSMTTLTLGRRTREIGIRLAIGATGREVLAVVLGAAAKYLTLGGLLGAVLATGFLTVQDRIFVVRLPAEDPWIVPAVVALLAAAGLLATWMPARRALRIEPSEALRED